jgi:hypothetical protein
MTGRGPPSRGLSGRIFAPMLLRGLRAAPRPWLTQPPGSPELDRAWRTDLTEPISALDRFDSPAVALGRISGRQGLDLPWRMRWDRTCHRFEGRMGGSGPLIGPSRARVPRSAGRLGRPGFGRCGLDIAIGTVGADSGRLSHAGFGEGAGPCDQGSQTAALRASARSRAMDAAAASRPTASVVRGQRWTTT